MKTMIVALLFTACTTDPLPSCADLGCSIAPSGSPDIWEPCEDPDQCWCNTEHEPLACEPEQDR